MRRIAGWVLAGLAMLGQGAARAQFQAPTQEELQMKSDPMAPGADAVYLYRAEKTDDILHYHSLYERIKVLTAKGEKLATVRVPYERGAYHVRGIEGRTIHPDGTIVKLTAKPSDLMALKVGSTQINTMVFTLPSVTVGSILEYRLDIQYDDNRDVPPQWEVQQPYYVHEAHYEFIPYRGAGTLTNDRGQVLNRLMYVVRGGNGATVQEKANGYYVYDVKDVPAIPTDDWAPPKESFKWSVRFYYTADYSEQDFWNDQGKYWQKISDKFANPTKELRNAVNEIVKPGDSDQQKAVKIYAAVQALENTDFARAKSAEEMKRARLKEVKDAQDVWKQKSGTSDQLALLFVALARAAGLTAYPMEVVDRNRALIDVSYLSGSQFDDYIAIVEVNGKEVFVDPGEKMCPFGLLAWKHSLAGGLRETAKGPSVMLSAPNTYKQDVTERVADLSLDAHGQLTGSVRIILTGQEALHWRQAALENNPDEVKKEVGEWIQQQMPDGVRASFSHFLELNAPDSELMAVVSVTGSIGSVTGKHVFLPAEFFSTRGKHSFVSEANRTLPVDVHFAHSQVDTVNYALPAGFTVESSVSPVSLSWPDHALMKLVSKMQGNTLSVARVLIYNYALLAPKEYSDLHDFYQKVAKADGQQIVLNRAPAAAGN